MKRSIFLSALVLLAVADRRAAGGQLAYRAGPGVRGRLAGSRNLLLRAAAAGDPRAAGRRGAVGNRRAVPVHAARSVGGAVHAGSFERRFGGRGDRDLPGIRRATGLASLAGAALVLLMVLGMAVDGRRLSSFTLLLTGVTMNSMAFAVILFLHNLASFSQSFAISRWLMGGLEAVEYSTLAWLAVVVVGVSALVTIYAPQWNLLAVGDDWAASRGVSTVRLTAMGYIAGSVLTGLVTSLTGPIGFVGLIVPHALRLKLGADHRALLPCAFLLGGAFLVACDTLSRTVIAPDGDSGRRAHRVVRRDRSSCGC